MKHIESNLCKKHARVIMSFGEYACNLRERFFKHVAELGATNLFLLFVLAVILLYPLLFVGFTPLPNLRRKLWHHGR